MIHSRIVWMLRPVERSMTVSAPQRIDQTSLSTSSATDEVTMELPMLALIFTRKLRPMIIGSAFRWLLLAGRFGPAAGDLVAHEFGGHVVGDRRAEAFAVGRARHGFGAAQVLAHRDVFHFLGD